MEKAQLQILAEWRRKKAPFPTGQDTQRSRLKPHNPRPDPSHHYVDAMKELQRLSRVSFPFSALILAEYGPINFPYFAEGVYRWIREEDARAGTWNRKVGYIFKQYRILIERVAQVRGRLKEESGMDVTALEAEKVGRWIIEAALKRRKPTLDGGEDDLLLRSTGNMVA
ncbi:hypothetical protein ABVK25_009258 [Lepraria finkii]|uniref:Uncharacterized protein n=1 Tax=Lepraria finkii TaxID=1340010 RepID=A0ABR4AXX5_9LECA